MFAVISRGVPSAPVLVAGFLSQKQVTTIDK
jgi:hypothetical protein